MSNFHIVHVIPDSRLHILNGYNEVIKTLIWGLRCHGHDVTYAVNSPRVDAKNIVLGSNMAGPETLAALPPNSILYNLEQIAPFLPTENTARKLRYLSERFEIWDYSRNNVDGWKSLTPECRVKLVPIGHAPIMQTIQKPAKQDIDVLFYGGPSEDRLNIFTQLCLSGVSAMFCFGIYGEFRDHLIGRSKLVVNISHNKAKIFSIVRVAHLLTNSKAVVADVNPEMEVESDIFSAVQFCSVENFTNNCLHYIRDDEARRDLEERALSVMSKRDIRLILREALAD